VTSHVNIGGIDQPVIGQRKIEHDIRLKEGEVNLLGGILEDQETKSLSGIPGLANVPILKYLFSQTSTEHRENEIVFALVPHIVRGQDLTDLNQKAFDMGTGTSIQLRRVSRPAPAAPGMGATPAAAPGASPTSQVVPQAAPPAPVPPTPAPVSGALASLAFDPASINQPAGSTFSVNVMLSNAQNVFMVPLQVTYDPKQVQVVNISNGGLLSQDGQAVALVHRDDESTGTLQITATRPPGSGGISGQGNVLTLTLLAKEPGHSTLTISTAGARGPGNETIPVTGTLAPVIIR